MTEKETGAWVGGKPFVVTPENAEAILGFNPWGLRFVNDMGKERRERRKRRRKSRGMK